MNYSFFRFCISCFSGIIIANSLTLTAYASEDVKQLHNPLQVEADQTIYLSKNLGQSANESRQREYLFKAPNNKVISNPQRLTRNQGYKVEVYGNAEDLLKKVKNIEPKAFRQGEIIQVGIFSEQVNAEILVRKLAVAGFWSRIVPH